MGMISARFWKMFAPHSQNAVFSRCDGTFNGKSAGALMSAAAKTPGDPGHVHRTLAADAHANASIRHFAEKHRQLDSRNAKRIVDQAFAVFVQRPAALHVMTRD